MIPEDVKRQHGYIYDKKNQSPLLVEMYQEDVENLMMELEHAIKLLEESGCHFTSSSLARQKQLMQGRIQKHIDRKEWREK